MSDIIEGSHFRVVGGAIGAFSIFDADQDGCQITRKLFRLGAYLLCHKEYKQYNPPPPPQIQLTKDLQGI
jgi:hypothetical protein